MGPNPRTAGQVFLLSSILINKNKYPPAKPAGPSKGPDRERNPKNIIVKVLVTPVIPAVFLSGNPDSPSLLFAPFDKGGNGGFLIVE